MKTFVEGFTITAIFWLAAVLDGAFDGIEPLRQFKMDFDMAMYWAIQELLQWVP